MALVVNDVVPSVQYTATASQTVFAYPYAIFADSDLTVYQTLSGIAPDDAADILVLTTNYTVSGAGTTSGGNMTLVTGAAVGDVITIRRNIPTARTTAYQNLGDLASTSFNDDLNKFVMMAQQNEEAFGRSISLVESTQTPTTFGIDDPIAEYYAVAKADLSGIKWLQLVSSGDLAVSAFAQTYLDDTTAAETLTTLGAPNLTVANTFTAKNTFSNLVVLAAGADIASATTIDLTAATGNSPRITGTTATSAVTMSTGQQMLVVADGAWPLTYHATTNKLNGGVSYTCVAGDMVLYNKDLSGVVHGIIIKADGISVGGTPAVQSQRTPDGALSTGTTVMPSDDTIPQNTEGDEYITVAITPTSSSNKLVISAQLVLSGSTASQYITAALFQDTTAGALAASQSWGSTDEPAVISITYEMTAGTTSATTFKIRAGISTAGTTTFNGYGAARKFGGVMNSFIKVTEVLP